MVPTADTRSLLYTLPFRLPARRGKADDAVCAAAAALGSSSAFLLGGTDVDRFSTAAATSLCCCRRETLLFEADRPLRSEPPPPPRERERRKRPTIDSEDEDAVEARSASVVSSRYLTSRFLCECFPFFVLWKLAIQSQHWFDVDCRKCLHVGTK